MNLIKSIRKVNRTLINVDLDFMLFTTNMSLTSHRYRQVVVMLFGGWQDPIALEEKTLYEVTGLDGSELKI